MGYVEIFRNIPLLVQLFLWYFVLPELLPRRRHVSVGQSKSLTRRSGQRLHRRRPVHVGAGGRAGALGHPGALPRGQTMAGLALGLTTVQTYRYVLLPMAYRIILPPLTSDCLDTIKNTSVAITIGLLELTSQARAMQEFWFQTFEAFTAASLMYLDDQCRCRHRHAPPRTKNRHTRLHHAGSERADVRQFRFRGHPPLAALSVPRRHDVHADVDRAAALGGIVFGTLIALMRLSAAAARRVAGIYVDFMRSLPLVLVIFWFYFLVPYIGQWITGASRPIRVGAFTSSLVTFILFEAAYFSEIMRAEIQAISKGQPAAAQALGLTYGQTMRYIVLPQAFRNMVPILLTQTIVLFQDTSVATLSIPDFLGAASKVAQRNGRLVERCLFAAAVYFVISCVASLGVQALPARS